MNGRTAQRIKKEKHLRKKWQNWSLWSSQFTTINHITMGPKNIEFEFELLLCPHFTRFFLYCEIGRQFRNYTTKPLQVNLFQKLLFLHQLTHNMTTDCSLNYKFNTWKFQAQTWGEHVVYRNSFWHTEQFLYTTCSHHVLQRRASDNDLPVSEVKYKRLFWSTHLEQFLQKKCILWSISNTQHFKNLWWS